MSSPDILCLKLPAESQYLAILGACTRAVACQARMQHAAQNGVVLPEIDSDFLYNVELGVHEVCSNIIEHAYGAETGQIFIRFTIDPLLPQLQIDLYDKGKAFVPEQAAPPNLAQPQIKGYGLFLAQQLLDTVLYERQNERNHWHLIKSW